MRLLPALLFALPLPAAAQDIPDFQARLEAGECPRNLGSDGYGNAEVVWSPCPEGIAPWSEVRGLIEEYDRLSHACRADPNGTVPECDMIGDMPQQIGALGWCWGREGEASYQNMWHGCETDSFGREAFPHVQARYDAILMPDTVDVVSNPLESAFSALLTSDRTDPYGDGQLSFECRRGKAPSLVLVVDRGQVAARGGSSNPIEEVSVLVRISTAAQVGVIAIEGDPNDLRTMSIMRVEDQELVLTALGSLYDEGSVTIEIVANEELPYRGSTVVLPDDQRLLDAIASVYVGCE